jgi:hypothetical protein
MTADPERTDTDGSPTGRSAGRRRLLLAVLGAVVVVAIVVVLLLLNRGDDASTASGSEPADGSTTTSAAPSSSTAPSSASAAPTSEPPAGDGTGLPPSLPAVPLQSQAAVGNGVTATLTGIEAIQGTASGPGNVAGPALRVTVRIQNGTADAVSLDAVAVNMYYDADRTPASPLEDPSQRPISGSVAPGQSADGVYVFTVPKSHRDAVTVEVGYQPGAPYMTWTGAVR